MIGVLFIFAALVVEVLLLRAAIRWDDRHRQPTDADFLRVMEEMRESFAQLQHQIFEAFVPALKKVVVAMNELAETWHR